jgi:NAD(P)-dependent dehydrogenase (short-subunit alcohol dehydrogenase family)
MGSASARLFAREGAAVALAAPRRALGNALAQEITDGGGTARFVQLEVTDEAQWTDAVSQGKAAFGGLHVLLNLVGTNELAMIPDLDLEVWNRVLEVNLTGTLQGGQTCAPLMHASGGGSIINIGSLAGLTATFSTADSTSKWGLEGLSRSAAYLLADWGIRCSVIQPASSKRR